MKFRPPPRIATSLEEFRLEDYDPGVKYTIMHFYLDQHLPERNGEACIYIHI
jgi:hypothetical protein